MGSDRRQLTENLDDLLAKAGAFLRSRPDSHTLPVTVTITETLRTRGAVAAGDEAPVSASAFTEAWQRHVGATTTLRDRLRMYRLGAQPSGAGPGRMGPRRGRTGPRAGRALVPRMLRSRWRSPHLGRNALR